MFRSNWKLSRLSCVMQDQQSLFWVTTPAPSLPGPWPLGTKSASSVHDLTTQLFSNDSTRLQLSCSGHSGYSASSLRPDRTHFSVVSRSRKSNLRRFDRSHLFFSIAFEWSHKRHLCRGLAIREIATLPASASWDLATLVLFVSSQTNSWIRIYLHPSSEEGFSLSSSPL